MQSQQATTPAIVLLIASAPLHSLAAEAKGRASTETKMPSVIHPQVRVSPAPAGGRAVVVNPPSLLWPVDRRRIVRYSVRLAQDREFPPAKTIGTDGLLWAIFNAHTQLAAGRWYWRYAAMVKGKRAEWSDVHGFDVPASARDFVTPPSAEMLATVPKSHPRVLIAASELDAFRGRAAGSAEAEVILRRAKAALGKPLRTEESGRARRTGSSQRQAKKFATWASKGLGGKMSGAVSSLARAYLLTGDEQLGRDAVRYAVHVAGFDPDGVTSNRVSDFADGSCLRAMALAYDSCFALLTDDEKSKLRDGIYARGHRMFHNWRNNLEAMVFNAHVWQHILHQFAEAAFATVGEIPEADQWAAYVYELWQARVPLLGGADGGWANGNNYFGTNYVTLIAIPTFFERLTGVSFFSHPWYRNTPYYLLYTWPPGSLCDGFGDGGERRGMTPTSRIGFADVLSREFQDPTAAWYADACLRALDKTIASDGSFAWRRLCAPADRKPPIAPEALELPQARAFRDIGVAAMHTDLANTPRNLMVAFRSSPYGSFNHMHADQNSFNILFAGKRLLHSTGYYIAYGDDHFKGWYKHSRGHNTVLIDGKSQPFGAEAYGWIARFLHGERISYCLGDASKAYGDAGLKRFRRHLVLLRPGTVVVYDDLEADRPAAWQWLLHSPEEMSVEPGKQRLCAAAESARCQVDLFGSTPLRTAVVSRFDPPALNWRKIKDKQGNVVEFADQWHATVEPNQRTEVMRYLAIIQVQSADDRDGLAQPVQGDDGWIEVGAWLVSGELDASKKASLEIGSTDGSAALVADRRQTTVRGKTYEADDASSTILVEVQEDKITVQMTADELPEAAR